MTLDEAFEYLENVYVRCAKEDVHKDERLIEAFRVVQAARPQARKALIEYWQGMKFEDLPVNRLIGKTATAHPLMRRVMRACRRPGWE